MAGKARQVTEIMKKFLNRKKVKNAVILTKLSPELKKIVNINLFH